MKRNNYYTVTTRVQGKTRRENSTCIAELWDINIHNKIVLMIAIMITITLAMRLRGLFGQYIC